jgi:SPP1 gp7 family putative phage head morphogenesis protein
VEGGDEFAADPLPMNLFGTPDNGEKPEGPEEDEEERAERAYFEDLGRYKAMAASPDLESKGDARALRWKAFDERVRPMEDSWAKEWRSIFRGLKAEVVRSAGAKTSLSINTGGGLKTETLTLKAPDDPAGPTGDLFDPADWARRTLTRLRALAARTFKRGAQDTLREIEGEIVPFDLEDPRVVAYIDRTLAEKITTIAHNRLSEVRDVVTASVSEGQTVGQLANRLRDHFDNNSSMWAKRIARTETAGLYNRGAEAGMEDAGIEKKEWLSSRDADVRASHYDMDGESVPLGADFVFPSGASGPYPGAIDDPAESINCRCALVTGDF